MTSEKIAQIIHGATAPIGRIACGNPIPVWEDLSVGQRCRAAVAVDDLMRNPHIKEPEDFHDIWANPLYDDGWVWGPVYSLKTKQHPCLVPYDELPDAEKIKDMIWASLIEVFRPFYLGGNS